MKKDIGLDASTRYGAVPDTANIDKSSILQHTNKLMKNPLWADTIIYIILFFAVVVTILPIWVVVVRSITPAYLVEAYPFLMWPKELSFEAYRYIISTPRLMTSFNITVFITVIGTFLNLLLTVPAGYALSKKEVPGVTIVMIFIIVTMLFGAGIIPLFMVVRAIGLLNSVWAMILPSMISAFNLILMRNFVWNIPKELEESAKIDGAGDLTVVWKIIIPLSKPIIATLGLFCAVGRWNEMFGALFFINEPKKWPLQLVLRSIIFETNLTGIIDMETLINRSKHMNPENIKAACIIFATIPILCVYPFLQKYFTKGIMIGAVKG